MVERLEANADGLALGGHGMPFEAGKTVERWIGRIAAPTSDRIVKTDAGP
jgi:hypothetical protein